MTACGILTENHSVELIHGELVEKMGIGDRHANSVDALNEILVVKTSRKARVRIQNPIQLTDSKPEPDVNVVRLRDGGHKAYTHQPQDILLLVEVSDTTLEWAAKSICRCMRKTTSANTGS
jgi:hypothetical protein